MKKPFYWQIMLSIWGQVLAFMAACRGRGTPGNYGKQPIADRAIFIWTLEIAVPKTRRKAQKGRFTVLKKPWQ